MLDLFLYFCEDFNRIKASVSKLFWKSEVEDNVFAILENTKKKIVASLHSTSTQWRHLFSIEIFLEKGYIVLNGLKTSSNSYGSEKLTYVKRKKNSPATTWKNETTKIFSSNKSWVNELNSFFHSIKQNKKPKIGNSNDALKIMKIISNIYNSK